MTTKNVGTLNRRIVFKMEQIGWITDSFGLSLMSQELARENIEYIIDKAQSALDLLDEIEAMDALTSQD